MCPSVSICETQIASDRFSLVCEFREVSAIENLKAILALNPRVKQLCPIRWSVFHRIICDTPTSSTWSVPLNDVLVIGNFVPMEVALSSDVL